MARFFVLSENIMYDENDGKALSVRICGSDVRHIKDVLRMKKGDSISVCDSHGNEYKCCISVFETDYIEASVEYAARCVSEPRILVTLYQGVAKGEKMDMIVQKNVELGINRIVPVLTEHTVVRYSSQKDAEKKQIRWQRISEEAAKQCGRGIVPEVAVPMNFKEAISDAFAHADGADTLYIMPYENETDITLKQIMSENLQRLSDSGDIKKICIFIGPEGGISRKEAVYAIENGFKSVTLGKRILRTETAGIAVVASVRYEIGD